MRAIAAILLLASPLAAIELFAAILLVALGGVAAAGVVRRRRRQAMTARIDRIANASREICTFISHGAPQRADEGDAGFRELFASLVERGAA